MAPVGLLLVALALGLAHPFGRRVTQAHKLGDYPEYFMEMPIDHFNPQDRRTFSQRFYVNDDMWSGDVNCPLFLEIGGEGEQTGPPSDGDEISKLAETYGGIAYALEHRYYGVSHPMENLTTESLKYLSSAQATTDLAMFIDLIDAALHPDTHVPGAPQNQWIVVGGSYSGALASWFRLDFPHMSAATIASSGVVNAIKDFTEFDHQVAESAGSPCSNALRSVTKTLEDMFQRSTTRQEALEMFGADIYMDNGDFFYMLADAATMAMQYGYWEECCDRMNEAWNEGTDLLEAFADFVNSWFYPVMNPDGPDGYDRRVISDEDNLDASSMMRQWWFQKCSELAYFQNAPTDQSIRSTVYVTMDYHESMCAALFGDGVLPDTAHTNTLYGAQFPEAYNTFYVDFWQDPWRHASVTENFKDSEPFLLVDCHNCGHCADMHAAAEDDPEELTDARAQIAAFVDEILSS
eukprot:gnl/Chilomastix_cuspidata/160.p2 GENE.gnl/Chilomastix_cuspidata/160~~gnl/Chilomastix_cuspidata/160.p2  ORF type:complete len:464 (+),score=212.23 gnl/Chilomastix_cuspidata/160:38-1429(+)